MAEQLKQPVPRPTRKGRVIAIILILAVVAALLGFTGYSLRNLYRYESAISLLKEAKYEEAAEAFDALRDYRDAPSYLLYSRAAQAGESGSFLTAAENLKALNGFSDSAMLSTYYEARGYESIEAYESAQPLYLKISLYRDAGERLAALPGKILERDYQAACALQEQGKDQAALRAFRALDGYKDSAARIDAISAKIEEENNAAAYASADTLAQQGKLAEARDAFLRLGAYKDSATRAADLQERINEQAYQRAAKAEAAGDALTAYPAFQALAGYQDSADRAAALEQEYHYQDAWSKAQAGNYKNALSLYQGLGDYKDSAAKADALWIAQTAQVTPIGDGLAAFRLGSKYGLINLNANRVTVARYDSLDAFNSLGLAAVSLNSRYGFIDATGDEVIPLQYRQVGTFDRNGLCLAQNQSGAYGYINQAGEAVIPLTYDALSAFSGGVCVARQGRLIGLMNTKGEALTDIAYTAIGDTSASDRSLKTPTFDSEGRLRVADKSGRYALMDRSYQILGGFDWNEIGAFNEGLARVKSGSQYGFIDPQGEIIVAPEWYSADVFSGGLCAVTARDGRYGYINRTGELVISAIYSDTTRFSNGYAAVCLPTVGWYMIDQQGVNARFAVVPYERAAAALESGDYEAAANGFSALGEYGDAHDQMLETYYRQALALRESGNLAAAYQLANQLSLYAQYKDSESLSLAIRADQLYEKGNTAEAWQLYAQVDEGLRRHQADYQEKFEAADALLQAEAYDEAIAAFQALGGYGESAARIEAAYDGKYQAEYAAALALMEAGRYEEAIDGFGALGEYSRAQEMALECRYLKALDEEKNGSRRTALLEMTALGEYKDAPKQAQRMQADTLFDSGSYADAWAIYAALEEAYRPHDADYARMYETAAAQLADGAFDDAEAGFIALGAYQDSADRVEACREGRRNAAYEAAKAQLEAGQFDEAAAGFTALGDYRDSADMVKETAYRRALCDAEQGQRNDAARQLVALLDAGPAFMDQLDGSLPAKTQAEAILAQPGYRDTAAQLCRVIAEQMFASGDYAVSWDIFSALDAAYHTRDAEFAQLYQTAADQLTAGQFDEAEAGFTALGAYQDSADQVLACQEARRAAAYDAALALLNEARYDEAAQGFKALGEYRDSPAMISECAYRHALAMDQAGDRQGALALLLSLMDDPAAATAAEAQATLALTGYKDVPAQICRLHADTYFEQGEYSAAWEIYAQLDAVYHTHDEDYQAMYDAAAQQLADKKYTESEQAFLALGGYRDSAQRAQDAVQAGLEDRYQQARALQENGQYDEAYDLYASLGDYSDSPAKLLEVAGQKADHLYQESRYAEAAEVYTLLGEQTRALDALWHEGQRLKGAGDYLAASAQWLAIPDYADSRAQNYAMAAERAEAGDSLTAVAVYAADPDYEDAKERIYQIGAAGHSAENYEVAVAAWTALGNYKDSGMNLTMDTYAYGGQLYDAGRFDEAAQVFRGMNGFSNTAERARDSAYQAAKAALEAGEYADAENRFLALGSYSDSADMVKETRYRAAQAALEAGDYTAAMTGFDGLRNYKDSADNAKAARYALAVQAYEAGNYQAAINGFNAIKDYRDATARWQQSRYMLYVETLAAGRFDEAIAGFETLADEGYTAAVGEASRAHYLKAQALDQEGKTEPAYNEYVAAGLYEDAAQLAKARAHALGEQYYAQADYPQAVKWYEIADDYDTAKAQLTKIGDYYFSVQDYPNAINAYKTLGADSAVAANLCRIGQYYEMQSDLLSAYLAYGYAGPDAAEGVAKAAAIRDELTRDADQLVSAGKAKEAIPIYETLAKIDPAVYPKLIAADFEGFIAVKGRIFRIGNTDWKFVEKQSNGVLVFIANTVLDSGKYDNLNSWLNTTKSKRFNAQEQPFIASLWIPSRDDLTRYFKSNSDRAVGGSARIWTSTKDTSYYGSYYFYYNGDGSMANYYSMSASNTAGYRPALRLKFNLELCQLVIDNTERYSFWDSNRKVVYTSSYMSEYAAAVEADQLKRYRRAMTLLERGEYDEASALFSELGDYQESARLVQECAYRKALKLAEAGQDEAAIAAFEALNGYSDSAHQIELAQGRITQRAYEAAVALAEAGQDEAAIAAFEALNGYSDSAEQIEQARNRIRAKRYAEAERLEKEEKYAEAYDIFADVDMSGYEDSAARAEEVAEKAAEQKRQQDYAKAGTLFAEGKLEEAQAIYAALDDYQDSAAKLAETQEAIRARDYAAAVAALEQGRYAEAAALFISLDNYEQSTQYLEDIDSVYKDALSLALSGKLTQSYEAFKTLGDYKDSARKAEIVGNLSRAGKTQKLAEGVLIYEFHGLWGIANLNTNVLTQAKYTSIAFDRSKNYAKNNLALVYISGGNTYNSWGTNDYINANDTYGYIDMNGKEVVSCQYLFVTDFNTAGRCTVAKSTNEKRGSYSSYYYTRVLFGIYDVTGKAITNAQWQTMGTSENKRWSNYDSIDSWHKSYFSVSQPTFTNSRMKVQKSGGTWGYINEQGQILGNADWQSVGNFADGMAMVQKNKKYGFIDEQGQTIGEVRWDEVKNFSQGLAAVRENGRWGFIDRTNTLVIPCRYMEVNSFKNENGRITCDVRNPDGTWTVIDQKGDSVFFQ